MGTNLRSRCGGNELCLTAASLGVGLPGKRISIGYFSPILLVESRSKATLFFLSFFSPSFSAVSKRYRYTRRKKDT